MDFLQQTGAFLEFRIYVFIAKTSYYHNNIVAGLLSPIKKMKTTTLMANSKSFRLIMDSHLEKLLFYLRLFIPALSIASLKHLTHLGGNLLDFLRI